MTAITTDYLVIGAGALGMAFADTLLAETGAHITMVDRHARPGGHWNDAYPFVALHQPSASYGVASRALGSGTIDAHGPNAGLYELATGPEVTAYFNAVMQQHFLPSGRVTYHPMSSYEGDGRIVSILSGKETRVQVRKRLVDATFIGTVVPSMQRPPFKLMQGVELVPPNALPALWMHESPAPRPFVVIGAGKTSMDTIVFLLQSGASPDDIIWVKPRETWLWNRKHTQPGMEFFVQTLGGFTTMLEAAATARTAEEIFLTLEREGIFLRVDPSVRADMFHYPTISEGEVALLRRVKNVLRKGHVREITRHGLVFDAGVHEIGGNPIYVNCTATAFTRRAPEPVFSDNRILLQMVRVPNVVLSGAMAAWVEAHGKDDAEKNRLCPAVPFPDRMEDWPATLLGNLMSEGAALSHPALMAWQNACRLNPAGKLVSLVPEDDAEKQAILARVSAAIMPAIANLQKLVKQVG